MPYNTAEGGSNGTTVLTTNSGGASGDAFDSVTSPPVDATLIFDNTHVAHGSLAYKFQIGATSTQLFLQYLAAFSPSNVTRARVVFSSYLTANPAASLYQLHVASAAAAQVCGVRINTSGQLIIVSQAGSTIGTMTSAIPLNAWFRVVVDIALDDTLANVNVRCTRYDNIDVEQPTDSVSATGTTAVPFSRFRFGWGGTATTNNGPWWMDDLNVYIPAATMPQVQPGQTWTRKFHHRQQLAPAAAAASGPQNYNQPLTGGLSFTGSQIHGIGKLVSGALSFTGTLVKSTAHALSGGLSFTGSLLRGSVFGKALSGGLSFVGSQTRSVGKTVSGGLSFTGSQTRAIGKGVTAGLSFTASIKRATAKGVSGALSFTGSAVKSTSHALTGGLSFTGSLVRGSVFSKALTGALSFTGSLLRGSVFGKALSGALSFTGSLVRASIFGKALSGTLSFVGSQRRSIGKTLTGGVSFTGTAVKGISKKITAALSFLGGLVGIGSGAGTPVPPTRTVTVPVENRVVVVPVEIRTVVPPAPAWQVAPTAESTTVVPSLETRTVTPPAD